MDSKRKRKVQFSDSSSYPPSKRVAGDIDREDVYENEIGDLIPRKESRLTSGKHTLDSDEDSGAEDLKGPTAKDERWSRKRYEIMDEEEIEGQEEEEEYVTKDDGDGITPFNLKEEMREGHFDKQGNYHFGGNEEDDGLASDGEKDAWVDSFDWKKIPARKEIKYNKDGESTKTQAPERSRNELLTVLVSHVQRGENVTQALARLGKSAKKTRLSFAERNE